VCHRQYVCVFRDWRKVRVRAEGVTRIRAGTSASASTHSGTRYDTTLI